MAVSLKTHKLLWGRSGSQCAICKAQLIIDSADPDDHPSIVGDEAHIIARTETFTRGNYEALSPEERDAYSNLILLCKVHHKQIDDQPEHFTVERLRELKNAHEAEVRSRRTLTDEEREQDEIVYSGYVDEWEKRADLEHWRWISTYVNRDTPSLSTDWYDAQKEFLIWFIGRIWPGRYPLLEAALVNYQSVLQDFLNEFDRHAERPKNEKFLYTPKFYHIKDWDPPRYSRLLKKYNDHVDLLSDLFCELTRAANYVCDRVRQFLFRGYRIHEGALLIQRDMVGFELRTEHVRVEYRGQERTKRPYPGLNKFKEVRYKRDYAIDPNPPKPPELDDQ